MVYRASEHPAEAREKMRGGEGAVTVHFLERALLPAPARLFARLTVAPGASIGEHAHEGEAEMFYFVSGSGEVLDDGVRIPVSAGDAMTTPSGHTHSVVNTGSEDLVIIASIVKEA